MQQVNQQELQHLIAVSTGFIDTYVIECHDLPPMLLPQNIVLSALDSATDVKTVDWHDLQLPVHAVHHPQHTKGVALVIEGEDTQQRFALMCNEMPQTMRLRISEVVDAQQQDLPDEIFQYVKVGERIFHVPNLQAVEKKLGL
ncbi:hypothetical protein [uncultured Acinetobacter sp.]|uniref:hypothetical protein n=1 Tax=uncultured Acinetobacter sp. TaxID=165433 RepID=UPI00262C8B5A|nr:hypothetical protein [uncultured Acinetobacter sp.]